MRIQTYCLFAMLASSGSAMAESLALENMAKQLLKDSVQQAVPNEAAQAADAANGSVEKAKNLKESMDRMLAAIQEQAADTAKQAKESVKAVPADSTTPAVDAAQEAGKQRLKQSLPVEARSTVKAAGDGVDQAKALKKPAKKTSKAAN